MQQLLLCLTSYIAICYLSIIKVFYLLFGIFGVPDKVVDCGQVEHQVAQHQKQHLKHQSDRWALNFFNFQAFLITKDAKQQKKNTKSST